MRQFTKLKRTDVSAQGGKNMKLYETGAYLIHGKDIVINGPEAAADLAKQDRG